MYDIIIIGAGVNGTFIARNLAKYNLKVLVLEKNSDVGDETSGANSAIIHAGYDPHPGTLKAELNVLGNKMYEEICKDLGVSFVKNGSLTIATDDEECAILEELYENSKINKCEVSLIDKDEIMKIEPFATKKAIKALYAKTAGIINPFELCVALMENAMDNGVELKLNEKVIDIIKDETYCVITQKSKYNAKMIINCAGLFGDEIQNFVTEKKQSLSPRKGEYYLLDHFPGDYVKHTLFSVPSSKGKGVLVAPTTSGNYLVGPSSNFVDEKEDKSTNDDILKFVVKEAYRLVDNLPMQHVITEFAGIRAFHESNDFVIEKVYDNFINVIGMQSPGLASAPATSLKVEKMVGEYFKLEEKANYIKTRRPHIKMKNLSIDEKNEIIKNNPLYGKIICRCEQISEGEIIDIINRNCGATTIKGVKKRARAGFGKCQGGYCQSLVLKILARELGKDPKEIMLANENSYILFEESKGKKI